MSKIRWFDCNGMELHEGDKIRHLFTGEEELVYECHPVDCPENTSLGVNASNEDFLRLHPDWVREIYPLSIFPHLVTVDGWCCLTEYEKVV